MKYKNLNNVLEWFCKIGIKKYPDFYIKDKSNKIKTLALIHLYLNARFGLNDFNERHDLITDNPDDGGVDAYYIDREKRKIYFIQSKFGNTKRNFEEHKTSPDELAKMEIQAILRGDNTYLDNLGNVRNFSQGIKKLQSRISNLKKESKLDIEKEIIILANVDFKNKTIKKLVGNYKYSIIDYKQIYDILFDFLSGVFYEPKDISFSVPVASYHNYACEKNIKTSVGSCKTILCFVSVINIAEQLDKYKNAILKYNPRCYLGLSGKIISDDMDNLSVNEEISRSLLIDNNDFAILNNGITILAKRVKWDPENGDNLSVDLFLSSPQIINGGQTAYTLSKLYKNNRRKIKNKEVMLKIIEITEGNGGFMNSISKAANKQNVINDDDRKSNDEIQEKLQKAIYVEFGYLYERKRGEFYNSVDKKIVDKKHIINKRDLAKSYFAFLGHPSEARSEGYKKIFTDRYELIFKNNLSKNDIRKMVYSYFSFKILSKKATKKDDYGINKFGYAIRYGKFAVVRVMKKYFEKNKHYRDIDVLNKKLNILVDKILADWIDFEASVVDKLDNKKYKNNRSYDYDNYYKGNTLINDLNEYFKM